jgi:hypothetical protein
MTRDHDLDMDRFEENKEAVCALMTAQGYIAYFNLLAAAGAAGLAAPFHSAWEKLMMAAIVGRVGQEQEPRTSSASSTSSTSSSAAEVPMELVPMERMQLVPMVSMDGRCFLLCENHAMLKLWHGGSRVWYRAPGHVEYEDEGDANGEGEAGSDQPTCSIGRGTATRAVATPQNEADAEQRLQVLLGSMKRQMAD